MVENKQMEEFSPFTRDLITHPYSRKEDDPIVLLPASGMLLVCALALAAWRISVHAL